MTRTPLSSLLTSVLSAEQNVAAVFLGKPDIVRLLFIGFLSGGHVLLDDIPGVGKTTAAKAMAAALGLGFRRVQFTTDIMPSDITGGAFPVYRMGVLETTTFRPGPVFSNILLADEINRAPPRTQSALLQAMAEQQVSVDGDILDLPDPFWVIATQNPSDAAGVFPLPDSQIDRFLFRLHIGYPSADTEKRILLQQGHPQSESLPVDFSAIRPLLNKQIVSSDVLDYLYRLVVATRQTGSGFARGLSPRAGLSILLAAKAAAWLSGRDFVSPDDIRLVFPPAAMHRVVATSGDPESVIALTLASIPVMSD